MASEQNAKTTNIVVIGSIVVIAILVFGTIWTGRSARKDTAKAVSTVSLLYLDELASDLPVILAIVSSYLDKPISQELCAIGEVGLTGEVRSVSNLPQRLSELLLGHAFGFSKGQNSFCNTHAVTSFAV